MTNEEHIERHKKLHKNLDELMADFISNTDKMPSQTTVMELIEWSHKQTVEPDHEEPSSGDGG
jgi:citrate synthase